MTDPRKKRIRQRFSRAAATYDAHADVQQELAMRLGRELPPAVLPARILEIGCGTGNFTAVLARRYPAAKIIALDFSENMIRQAREKLGGRGNLSFLCEDGERFLAACASSFDLICSNSTMQWFDDIDAAFAGIRRLLAPEGHFLGALFGPRTFYELSRGLSHCFAAPVLLPPHRFPGRETIAAMAASGLKEARVQEVEKVRQYGSLLDLLDHIRKTGTGGGQQLPATLTRGRLRLLDAWFQEHFNGYPATYQAFIVKGGK
ncbi:methyltransferase domain-containing protein [Thiovibrio sp. JS02]